MRKTKFDIVFFILPIITDIIIVEISMLVSYWVRFYSGITLVTKSIPYLYYYSMAGWVGGVILTVVFYLLGLYDSNRRPSIIDDIYDTLKGSLIGLIIILAPTFFVREFTFSRLTIVIASTLAVVLFCVERVVFKYLKKIIFKKGIGVKNVIVLGDDESVNNVIEKLKKNPESGYRIYGRMGTVDTDKSSDIPFLGNVSQLRNVISSNSIDIIILTSPIHDRDRVTEVLTACQDIPVQIMLYPDPYDILTSKIEYQDIDGLTLIGLRSFPFSYWSTLFKRLFDIILSLIFLIIITPILLIVAIFIKITSKGSILYLQNRVGEQGKLFNILKFRTMKENAEEETGPIFASPNDHRTTRIGKVLRKTSIDELPQLFNVLKGDMSLVGPRPERPNFVEHFRDEVPRYIERHKVKPGITGWAQVHGLRGDSSIKERVKYDLFYIENWSIGMDIKIILQTLYTLIKGENAY